MTLLSHLIYAPIRYDVFVDIRRTMMVGYRDHSERLRQKSY